MQNRLIKFSSNLLIYSFIAAVIALAACLVCPNAYAGPLQDGDLVVIDAQPGNIPIGYLVYDVVFPGNLENSISLIKPVQILTPASTLRLTSR
jgi:hypothetical protein